MQEKVYVVTESELDELIALRQTEALRTIYTIAKDSPNASWNELVVRSAEELQNPGSYTASNSTVAVVAPEETVEEPVVEEELAELLPEDFEEEEFVEEIEEQLEELDETDPDLSEDTDDLDSDDEEEEELFGVTPTRSFRNNDSRMIREASIFDE